MNAMPTGLLITEKKILPSSQLDHFIAILTQSKYLSRISFFSSSFYRSLLRNNVTE
jgi:hypothetical protein